jgi:hypothetical protein
MRVQISGGAWLWLAMATTACAATPSTEADIVDDDRPFELHRSADRARSAAQFAAPPGLAESCGALPSSLVYWASAWQRDIVDVPGAVGGCVYDDPCMPRCWGTPSPWLSWAGPLVECPCRVHTL